MIDASLPPTPAGPLFSSLPLSPATLANLATLGYTTMTPIQAASLPLALAGHSLRDFHGTLNPGLAGHEADSRAIRPQQFLDLRVDAYRHADFHGMAEEPPEEGESNARIPGRGLDDRLARRKLPGYAGGPQDPPDDPVLDAPGRVLAFELGEQAHAGLRR